VHPPLREVVQREVGVPGVALLFLLLHATVLPLRTVTVLNLSWHSSTTRLFLLFIFKTLEVDVLEQKKISKR
jgi:hypothetical protein